MEVLMTVPRRYSVADVRWIVELFREHGENVTADQVAGMDMLVGVLKSFENMTDADIEAAIKANWHRL
jgi:hypothetical protein